MGRTFRPIDPSGDQKPWFRASEILHVPGSDSEVMAARDASDIAVFNRHRLASRLHSPEGTPRGGALHLREVRRVTSKRKV